MKRLLFFVMVTVMTCGPTVFAVPQLINYQGQLTAPDGTPLDTTVSVTFTVYDAFTGGTNLWTETQPSVAVENGLFAVQLGSVTALNDLFTANRWLGIAVGNDTEMLPRQQIVSVAHSYRVGTVDGASGGTITGDVIAAGKTNFGFGNTNTGGSAFVTGSDNSADGAAATISGGESNSASGNYSVIGGGAFQHATAYGAAILGGEEHTASGVFSTVGGGSGNDATRYYAAILGGGENVAADTGATVGGGRHNRARGSYAVISGGGGATLADSNSATGAFSAIGGGHRNSATDSAATVGGGAFNEARNALATIGGGYDNRATGRGSTVGGGESNVASGFFSVVPGGRTCLAQGSHSLAAGFRARALHLGSFVWGDLTNNFVSSTSDNQFTVRASGGVRLFSNAAMTLGAELPPNASAWVAACDSTKKNRHGRVDTQEILDKVSQLSIEQWDYKEDPNRIQHIGPMAQEFYSLFHLGESDTTISTLDPDGVALAAIQELATQLDELRNENLALRARVQTLEAAEQKAMKEDK